MHVIPNPVFIGWVCIGKRAAKRGYQYSIEFYFLLNGCNEDDKEESCSFIPKSAWP